MDAQEAVLGLLSMGSAHNHVHFHQDEHQNRHHHHHHHHHNAHNTSSPTTSSSSSRITPAVTSSATLNSILTTTTSPHIPCSSSPRFDSEFPTAPTPTIPAKRKQRDVGYFEEQGPQQRAFHPPTQYPFENGHPRPYDPPRSAPAPLVPAPSEAIDCMCGYTIDNGFSVACDRCSRWCHGVCFGLTNSDETREINFWCWRCEQRSPAEIEFAKRAMEEKLAAMGGPVAVAGADGEEEVVSGKRRKGSPGTERKRRASTAVPGEGGKRRRRLSAAQLPTPVIPAPNGGTTDEEQHVDIDEPWTQAYVHIAQDIVPSDETRTKLRRHAQHWRGVTAVTPTPAPIAVTELPSASIHNPFLPSSLNPDVLPPAYGVHATQPISSDHLITPFLSRITPSTSYLADPLNAYAHLGMPKPFVHLMGPPLGVALDARQVGNEGRFVRSGCRPNAVLRPVLCEQKGEETLGFGVFALRDLRVGEEVVLGWEWDDGNAVHTLPALLKTQHMFP